MADYKYGDTNLKCAHFAQLVWVGSKRVGIGRGVGNDGRVVIVAHYSPPGNVVGEWKDNVLPPNDGRTDILTQLPAVEAIAKDGMLDFCISILLHHLKLLDLVLS